MTNDPFSIAPDRTQSVKWNFSNKNNPDYRESITGDIVEIRQVQSKNHVTKEREWWPDGNAKLNMLFVIDCPELGGEVPWIFSPKSAAAKAVKDAMNMAGIPASSWANMANMNITVSTQDGVYAAGHPRPWWVAINGPSTSEFRGCFPYTGGTKADWVAREQIKALQQQQQPQPYQQAPQQQYQQPMQQGYQNTYAQPQFDNPGLQQAFNNAANAVHQSQFNVPQQEYIPYGTQPVNWGNEDYYDTNQAF